MSAQPCGCDWEAGHQCASHSQQFQTHQEEAISGKEYLGKDNARKTYPVASGVLDYFPLAIMEVAHVSWVGQQQHKLTGPLHWDRSKSGDEADALIRHFLARGIPDTDGISHTAKVAWRALALLQKELEQEGK